MDSVAVDPREPAETEHGASRDQQRDYGTQYRTAVRLQEGEQLFKYKQITAGRTLFGYGVLFASWHIEGFQVRKCSIVRRVVCVCQLSAFAGIVAESRVTCINGVRID